MNKNTTRPVAPFYVSAGMWALYILLFPVYWLRDWLVLALVTGCVFFAARELCGIVRSPKDPQPWHKTMRGAAAILAAVILLTSALTLLTRPAALPDVSLGEWISDENDLLSEDAENEIRRLNELWNESHNTVCAVAIVDSTKGWTPEVYGSTLGSCWSLGPNDLLLVFDSGASTMDTPVWHLSYGDTLTKELSSQQLAMIQEAFAAGYAESGLDGAVTQTFQSFAAVFPLLPFDTTDFYMMFLYNFYTDSGWKDHVSMRVTPVLLSIASVFAVWAILDRRRYRAFQDLCEAGQADPRDYTPVFWGRN